MPEQISPLAVIFIVVVVCWELYWKGRGMWVAARENEKNWFIAILLIASVGLLPIYYLKHYKKPQYKPAVPPERHASLGTDSPNDKSSS